jgi:hypothetical protein
MAEIFRWLRERPWIFVAAFAFAFLWNVAYVVWRIRKLRREGRDVFARVPEGALFVEKWTSGGSDLTFWSRLGGARNCLLVALTADRLVVRGHFPFNLFGVSSDLEHDVPVGSVEAVEAAASCVRVRLAGRTLTLALRNPNGFLGAWAILQSRRRRGADAGTLS